MNRIFTFYFRGKNGSIKNCPSIAEYKLFGFRLVEKFSFTELAKIEIPEHVRIIISRTRHNNLMSFLDVRRKNIISTGFFCPDNSDIAIGVPGKFHSIPQILDPTVCGKIADIAFLRGNKYEKEYSTIMSMLSLDEQKYYLSLPKNYSYDDFITGRFKKTESNNPYIYEI